MCVATRKKQSTKDSTTTYRLVLLKSGTLALESPPNQFHPVLGVNIALRSGRTVVDVSREAEVAEARDKQASNASDIVMRWTAL